MAIPNIHIIFITHGFSSKAMQIASLGQDPVNGEMLCNGVGPIGLVSPLASIAGRF